MGIMASFKKPAVRNAFFIGGLCSTSYLGVYFARNILGAVTPQIVNSGIYSESYIGTVSSLYFMFYAVGQLINGLIGDKINARIMISFGLIFAGITNFIFPFMLNNPNAAQFIYGMTGFFLSMIYAPMTKVVAENTEPIYAARCSLGYTFASFFGSPLAGIAAALLVWTTVFTLSSSILVVMGIICFIVFLTLEKKGIVKYHQFDKPKEENKGSIKLLIKRQIIKFTIISVITGIVRTTVVFWLPTYISQYLGFSSEASAMIFTIATFIISFGTFIAVFTYEKLKRNIDHTNLLSFAVSATSFILVYFIKQPLINVTLMVVAIMASNSAATMLWSIYCPSLKDTGKVSSATGFLDFMSYMAAAASSTIFANAVSTIGWKNLILVWFILAVFGVLTVLPWKRKVNS